MKYMDELAEMDEMRDQLDITEPPKLRADWIVRLVKVRRTVAMVHLTKLFWSEEDNGF